MYLVPDQHVLLMIGASLFGFFCNGVFALSLEMGVETTYPVEETISATLMYVTSEWQHWASFWRQTTMTIQEG